MVHAACALGYLDLHPTHKRNTTTPTKLVNALAAFRDFVFAARYFSNMVVLKCARC
jgi:hypothetical protein